jgi:uncharacterized protein YkwD
MIMTRNGEKITMHVGRRLGVFALVGMMLCWSAYSQTPSLRAERELFAAANQARRAEGLPPLRWDEGLAAAARRHAQVMADHGTTAHGFEGEPSLSARVKQEGVHFGWLSENVTQGPSPDFIHVQFMRSPAHRANILDRDMDSVGVGVIERGGQLFAVEDFAQSR